MFKKGPLTSLAANFNASSIFKKSKRQNKVYAKEPDWYVAPDAVTMSKVVNERESEEVIQQQEKMREQAKVNGKRNDKRIDDLRKMQADLREKFIESNNFARECHEKEYSLDKQIEAERKIQEKLEAEIKDYEERTKNLEDFHENKFKPAIEEMKVYEDVLQEVVDQMDLFKSKEDFLDRCEAILLAQKEVAENDEVSLKDIEEMQADVVKMSNDATSMIAGFENELNQIEKDYERTLKEYLKWESVIAPMKDVITEKEKETFMLLDQIQQLYLLLCKRSGIEPEYKRDQVEEQLDYIKREIEILEEIIEMAEEMTELENRSDIAEHGSGKSGKPRK